MAVSKSDLIFTLTGVEPLTSQTSPSQSIGGYPSTTVVNPSTILSSTLSLITSSFLTMSGIGERDGIVVNDEFMSVSSISDTLLSVGRGAFSTEPRLHLPGDLVYGVNRTFFNNSFNEDLKQYRCIAVTNEGTEAFSDLRFYFKKTSRNTNSAVRLAIEAPRTEIITGTATGGNTISLVDSSLRGAFTTEYDGCVLTLTSGSNDGFGQAIATFDSVTGTFTFLKKFPYVIESGTEYRVEVAPSQRIISGGTPPEESDYFSGFSTPSSISTAISIDLADRTSGTDLEPNETVYLWLERSVSNNEAAFDDNRLILTATYRV